LRIQALEISGFKSFGRRTTLVFGRGVSAVVGPNGCGKSNVVDAIRWVMGEQNPRLLRGRRMEDMIFGGTEAVPQSGMAEVIMTLANDEGDGPPLYSEFSEIQITRRLYRSGESEYLINKVASRLRDVLDLVMDTGVGSRGYTIVEQGAIAGIVSSKPEERRQIFEEAAGIGKYRARRKEAESKLKSTEQNLLRVKDVLAELTRQIGSLDRQARRANRFKKLSAELRELELALSYEKTAKAREDLAVASAALVEDRTVLTGLDARVARAEADIAGDRLAHAELEREAQIHAERLYGLRSEVQSHEGRIEWDRRESEALARSVADREAEIEERSTGQERARIERQESELEREAIADALATADEEHVARERELAQAREALSAIDAEQDAVRERASRLAEESARLRSRAEARAERARDIAATLAAREAREAAHAAEVETLGAEQVDLETRHAAATAQRTALDASLGERTASQRALQQAVEARRADLLASQGELQRVAARLGAVREEQRRASAQLDKLLARLPAGLRARVLGTVAEHIQVESGLERALEAVLACRPVTVIVEETKDAVELIAALEREAAGRAAALPIVLARNEAAPARGDAAAARHDLESTAPRSHADVALRGDAGDGSRADAASTEPCDARGAAAAGDQVAEIDECAGATPTAAGEDVGSAARASVLAQHAAQSLDASTEARPGESACHGFAEVDDAAAIAGADTAPAEGAEHGSRADRRADGSAPGVSLETSPSGVDPAGHATADASLTTPRAEAEPASDTPVEGAARAVASVAETYAPELAATRADDTAAIPPSADLTPAASDAAAPSMRAGVTSAEPPGEAAAQPAQTHTATPRGIGPVSAQPPGCAATPPPATSAAAAQTSAAEGTAATSAATPVEAESAASPARADAKAPAAPSPSSDAAPASFALVARRPPRRPLIERVRADATIRPAVMRLLADLEGFVVERREPEPAAAPVVVRDDASRTTASASAGSATTAPPLAAPAGAAESAVRAVDEAARSGPAPAAAGAPGTDQVGAAPFAAREATPPACASAAGSVSPVGACVAPNAAHADTTSAVEPASACADTSAAAEAARTADPGPPPAHPLDASGDADGAGASVDAQRGAEEASGAQVVSYPSAGEPPAPLATAPAMRDVTAATGAGEARQPVAPRAPSASEPRAAPHLGRPPPARPRPERAAGLAPDGARDGHVAARGSAGSREHASASGVPDRHAAPPAIRPPVPAALPGALLLDSVSVAPHLRPAVERLLGGVRVVDTFEDGLAAQRTGGCAGLVLTRAGELLEPSGVLVGGAAAPAGDVSRASELRRLTESHQMLSERVGEQTAAVAAAVEAADRARADVEATRREIHAAELSAASLKKDLERARERGRAAERARDDRRRERDALVAEKEGVEGERAAAAARLAEIDAERAGLEDDRAALADRATEHQHEVDALESQIVDSRVRLAEQRARSRQLSEACARLERQIADAERWLARSAEELAQARARVESLRESSAQLSARLRDLLAEEETARLEQDAARARLAAVSDRLSTAESLLRAASRERDALRESLSKRELSTQELRMRQEQLYDSIRSRYDVDLASYEVPEALAALALEEKEEQLAGVRKGLDSLGQVYLGAIEEYEEVAERHRYLTEQEADLTTSVERLRDAIARINRTSRTRFRETFDTVNAHFQQLFPKMFLGGRAHLTLTETEDLLDAGIEIHAQPPGKKLQSIDLLSGGEKSLTALALLMSVFLVRPSPFFLLDEVDAALDDANVGRFDALLREMSTASQFLVITHNKASIESADRLFGVTMQERGLSKLVQVDLLT
jgi:chromosome segregation ATPase